MLDSVLTHKDVGQRIAQLRLVKGLTQDDLARSLSVSRTSITQLEHGRRKLYAVELAHLMQLFGLSADAFLFDSLEDFTEEKSLAFKNPAEKEARREQRISSPHFKLEKMRNVILYLAEKIAGKPEADERFLQLLTYFTDFDHYELYEEQTTGAKYIKMSLGPAALEFQPVLAQLIADKAIMRIHTETPEGMKFKYLPLRMADLVHLSATEKDVMDNVVERFANWNYNKLSAYAKGDMPYMATEIDTTIDYNLAFYREGNYTLREYN